MIVGLIIDDSNVPIQAVIENIIEDVAPKGFVVGSSGGLEVDADAENFEVDGCDKELPVGRGKRQKKANRLYVNNFCQWRHNDADDTSDED